MRGDWHSKAISSFGRLLYLACKLLRSLLNSANMLSFEKNSWFKASEAVILLAGSFSNNLFMRFNPRLKE